MLLYHALHAKLILIPIIMATISIVTLRAFFEQRHIHINRSLIYLPNSFLSGFYYNTCHSLLPRTPRHYVRFGRTEHQGHRFHGGHGKHLSVHCHSTEKSKGSGGYIRHYYHWRDTTLPTENSSLNQSVRAPCCCLPLLCLPSTWT